MPTVRPAAIETSMPVTECHESTTITAAMAYSRIFQLHLTVERVEQAWPGGGQEGRHAGVDVGQQPGAV